MNPLHAVIALVENDLPTNRAFARLLRAHGFTVEAYPSAELLLARAPGPAIDCLLLDVDLDGMSGLDLQQQLYDRQAPTPIIFITGRDDPAVRARAFELGCASFLCKPVESHVLVDAIHAALN
jgi:FixJ family two-component response regulator